MKFNVEDLSTVKKILHIEIPKEEIKKSLDNAYLEIKKTAKIKGFRIGKTPRSVLEQMYKKSVHADISSKLIQDGLTEALRESKLNFVGSKQIDPPELNINENYCFKVEVDVKPPINTIQFKGLKLKRTLYSASDKEVNTQLSMLQKSIAKKESIKGNRPVKTGDFVVIDYEGFRNEKPFKEVGKVKNFIMEVGLSSISDDLDKGIEGMSLNEEKKIYVKFPNNYKNQKLANLEILFKVKINDIKEEILPEINDNMAKQFGSFEDLADLKAKILTNLKEGYEKRKEQEINEQIFTQLIGQTEFELPESLIQYELDAIIADTERSFKYHNKSIEEAGLTREVFVEKYEEVAKKQVRRQLILGQIIEQEKIIVSEIEIEKELEKISTIYNNPIETIKTFYKENPDKLENFKHALLEKRAIEVIISNSNVEEVEPELVK